jgi:hypothetical protein
LCDPLDAVKIVQRFPLVDPKTLFFPTVYTILLNPDINLQASLDLQLDVYVSVLKLVDVMVVLDLNLLATSDLLLINTQLQTLLSILNQKGYAPRVGCAVVTPANNAKGYTISYPSRLTNDPSQLCTFNQ